MKTKKVEALIGHINFYDHYEPVMQHAIVLQIGKKVFVNIDTAEEEAETLMDDTFQGYIIPDFYKDTIKYSLP